MTNYKFKTSDWDPVPVMQSSAHPQKENHPDLRFQPRHFMAILGILLVVLSIPIGYFSGMVGVGLMCFGIGIALYSFAALLIPSRLYKFDEGQ